MNNFRQPNEMNLHKGTKKHFPQEKLESAKTVE